ncbi:hypothetical protein BX661DRAFT_179732 [Kickxella alabastrina]|uniref:uncharacterized protein n=1 Tax=Kickxella alabastrina TaxID=61397 RepID=UPI00221EBF5A|nr:uncharacterized protein BX661DRAFT_179732 [Kickxella alabastrina]KAI7832058.1 hypothetical protein BX661DRAFT_179732 [Kickxella alabastrina]
MPTADRPIHDKHCTAVVHDLWSEFVGKSQTRISDKHIRGERFSNAEIDDEVYNLSLVKKLGSSGPHITQPCVHRRYVTRLPGSPITEITSVPDLIVAAAGAMGWMLTNFERSAVKSSGSAAVKDENSKDGGFDKSLFIDMDVDDDDMEVDPSLDPSAKENKWVDGNHYVASLNSERPTSGPTAELEDWASLIDTLIWMGSEGWIILLPEPSPRPITSSNDIMGLHEQSTPYHAMHYFMFGDAFSRLLGRLNRNELRDGLFDYTRRADDFDRPSAPMNEAELSPTQFSQSVNGDNIRSGMCARIVTRLTKFLNGMLPFFKSLLDNDVK